MICMRCGWLFAFVNALTHRRGKKHQCRCDFCLAGTACGSLSQAPHS